MVLSESLPSLFSPAAGAVGSVVVGAGAVVVGVGFGVVVGVASAAVAGFGAVDSVGVFLRLKMAFSRSIASRARGLVKGWSRCARALDETKRVVEDLRMPGMSAYQGAVCAW